ncbi:TIR domain-containing protein [Reyranella sp.]|uniref:nSTAND1 domain-containing NTPase n=1 Tax=Reyranella sp. TaxID=1929291 RepID=UPI001222EABD|nr:TIR domain-containing protein [Reyranella sp.]TAJ84534.1 MAG: TIR domain-containing protein [Reyranella sp.]
MAAIFISHSSRDNEAAGQIKSWLDAEGYEQVFLDFDKETGLGAGREWERQLYEAIDRCHAVLLLVTPAWLASKWCFVEFTQARALGKVIFPIVLTADDRNLLGPPLSTIQAEQWNDAGRAHLAHRLKDVAAEIARGYRWDPSRAPWPGIMSFAAEDAAVFFGRDPEIREICERLEARRAQGGARLLLIVGASGSGKSSVLKAGVLRYLAKDRRRFVTLPPFRPGRTPMVAFAKVLAEALGKPGEYRAIRAELAGADPALAFAELTEALTIGPAREATILISIDQFEELFTTAKATDRADFLRLLSAVTAVGPEAALPVQLVATVRSDLLGEILKSDGFAAAHDVFTLGGLPADRVKSVIAGPAEVAAIGLEDGLVERILGDVGTAPEALPLLAFTLRELYERHGRDRKLTLLEYEELGDRERNLRPLENAVRRTAEDTLKAAAPEPDEMLALREAFVGQLVRVNDEGVRLRRPARQKDIPERAHRLVKHLTNARLLSSRSEGDSNAVEVAHEALFKAWPQLASWLDEEQDFLIGRRQIEDAERRWAGTPDSLKDKALLSGLLLDKAREWSLAYPDRLKSVHAFVAASLRQAEQEVLRLKDLYRRTLLNETRALSAVADLALTEDRPAEAVKLALAAWPRNSSDERPQLEKVLQTLSTAISRYRWARRIERFDDPVRGALVLANGRVLSWSQKDTLRLWDAATHAPVGRAMYHDEIRGALELTNGRLLSWSFNDTLRQWNADTGMQIGPTMQHDDRVVGALELADGRLLSWSEDKTLRLWDAATGRQIGPAMSHDDKVWEALVLADGRLLSWSEDKTLRLWDAGTGAQIGPALCHDGPVSGVLVLSDGRLLSWSEDKTLRLWDAATGAQLGPAMSHDGKVGGALELADGRLLSWCSDVWNFFGGDDKIVRLWDARTCTQIGAGMRHDSAAEGVVVMAGNRLLTWSGDRTLRLWDLTTQTQIGPIMRHDDIVRGALALPDGRLLSWSRDRTLRFWDASTGEQAGPVLRHDHDVWGALVLPDGRLLSWSEDKTVRWWDVSAGVKFGPTMRHDDKIRGTFALPDGRLLSWSNDKTLRLWNAATGAQIGPAMCHDGAVDDVRMLADGRLLSWSRQDRTLRLWDAATGAQVGSVMHHDAMGQVLVLTDGRLLSSSWEEGTMRLWNPDTGAQVGPTLRHDTRLRVLVLADGRLLSFSADESTLRLWNPDTGTQVGPTFHHRHVWNALELSGGRLVSGSSDGTLCLWDVSTGEQIGSTMSHDNCVDGMLELADGRVLSWSRDDTLRLWDTTTGEQTGPAMSHDSSVEGALILADGRLLSWSQDKTLRLWDAATGAQIGPALRHDASVWGAKVLAGGRLLSWSNDNTLRLWDAGTNAQIGPALRHDDAPVGALELADGRLLVRVADDTLVQWKVLPPGSLFEVAYTLLPDLDLESVAARYGLGSIEQISRSPQEIPLPDWNTIERLPR